MGKQVLAGEGVSYLCYFFWRTFGHDVTTPIATFGTQVDDMISDFDDVKIVFDDDDGIAFVNQPVQSLNQFGHIVGVQANGWFVENIDGATGGDLGEFAAELDALRFAAAQCRGWLAQVDIAQTNVDHGL